MANFVNDYSNLAGAGAAFNSFAEAYERAQDSQSKRQEMQARMESEKTKAQREADQTAISARVAGLQKNATNGNYEEAPLSPKERSANMLKAFGEGAMPTGTDEQGNPTGYKVDTTTPRYKAALNSGIRTGATLGTRQDNQSAAAINKIHQDHTLVGMRGQAANVDKGLHTLEGSADHKPTWIEVNEIAQDYANALSGNKGSSDFKLKQSEQQSFDKFLGDLKGKINSDPNQPADQAYIDFYKNFGSRLKGIFDKQMASRANNLLVGAQRAYKHNPDAYEAMKEAAGLYKNGGWRESPDIEQTAPAPQQAPAQQAPPQGLVQPQQGLLGRIAGFLSPSAQAAPQAQQAPTQTKPQTVIQNGHTYTLNPKTGQYE